MYSWGDDTSDWARPGAYTWDGKTRSIRDAAAIRADAEGPRSYDRSRSGPDEQRTSPRRHVRSTSTDPLIVAVDVTGSMAQWPYEIFDRLPLLYQTLSQYRPELEVSFVAIGDARCDRWPLQVTDFARGFLLDEHLKALYGEGGGGDEPESYGLFAEFVRTRVATPNADRPFLIVFGDATMHPRVLAGELRVLGESPRGDVDALEAWREVSRTWNTWFLRRPGGRRGDAVDKQWSAAIGAQQVVAMDDEQRAVDYAMGLVARSWGHFDDFAKNMGARQGASCVASLASRVASIEDVIERAKAPRVVACPKCGGKLPATDRVTVGCDYCGATVHLPFNR